MALLVLLGLEKIPEGMLLGHLSRPKTPEVMRHVLLLVQINLNRDIECEVVNVSVISAAYVQSSAA